MKTEFSISKELADKLVGLLSQPGIISLINTGREFYIYSDTEIKACLRYDIGETFSFHTREIELFCSVLKNSNEWNFIRTNSSSFTLNGIKIRTKDLFGVSTPPMSSEYLLSMTKEEFDSNFSLFKYTQISRVINNKASGVSFIFGNKTIKTCALDYSVIATTKTKGDINEAEINNCFKHDTVPITFNEDDINFIRKFIDPTNKINIKYGGESVLYFVNGDIWFSLSFNIRPQTLEMMKVYDDLFLRATDYVKVDKLSIFNIFKMLSDCKNIETVIMRFSTGLITISLDGAEIAKIKDKKITEEKECEINVRSLFLILDSLNPMATVNIKKTVVDADTYYIIEDTETNSMFLLIG
jgi:hypothetical protein